MVNLTHAEAAIEAAKAALGAVVERRGNRQPLPREHAARMAIWVREGGLTGGDRRAP